MSCVEVSTQNELDAATARGDCAHVRGAGYFTAYGSAQVRAYGSAQVRAYGSAQVRAYGSAQVRAYDSAQVRAYGSAQVRAYDSAQVTAYDSAQVTAYDSAQVRAYDSAQVRAYGSAQVRAYDSAQVTAYGSAQVRAYDSAQVRAYGSAQVTAYGSAQVRAYDSAQVTAGAYTAVTVHGVRTKVTGGVLITLPEITTAEAWCEFYGVDVVDGVATLFKAVSAAYVSPHGFDYTPGTTPVAPDWDGGKKECGGGLHFSPRPTAALRFFDDGFDTKFIACPVRVADIVVHHPAEYPDKVKAPGCCGPVVECDINGEPLAVAAATA